MSAHSQLHSAAKRVLDLRENSHSTRDEIEAFDTLRAKLDASALELKQERAAARAARKSK